MVNIQNISLYVLRWIQVWNISRFRCVCLKVIYITLYLSIKGSTQRRATSIMLSGFWHEKNIIASMVHACGIIKYNTKRQTHKLCKETPILHELKCDFSTNNLNIYYTYKMKSVSWIIDKIRCSFMFQPRRKQLTFIAYLERWKLS